MSTQPSIPPGSVNEYQLRLGRQRAGMAHSDCGWTCGCAGKTVKSLENMCHMVIPERFCGGDSLWRGAISSVCTFTFNLLFTSPLFCRSVYLSLSLSILIAIFQVNLG